MHNTDNLRIRDIKDVIPPAVVKQEYPISANSAELVSTTRREIHDILIGKDQRLLVIIGPCSIHDPLSAIEYAQRLQTVSQSLKNDLLIVMRVYFEKPRTRVGWKGLINDPFLDESFEINNGLRLARKLLIDISALGLPTGTEFLDMVTGQYLSDLISWGAIGARTTESQIHRELASGLSCPVGFKNSTDGSLKSCVDAVFAAKQPHIFLSPTNKGNIAIFSTNGNQDCHIILRGGKQPNYNTRHVASTGKHLTNAGLIPLFMIDFSHANSQKQYEKQLEVGDQVAQQICRGEKNIMGVMIESHLQAGHQKLISGQGQSLVYGQSITDACLSWEQSEPLLTLLSNSVRERRST